MHGLSEGMLKTVLLLALGALCVVDAAKFTGSRTADMDFVTKQKKAYELLLYVRQSDLIDAEYYDIGRNYNIESNIDMYQDKVIKYWCYNYHYISGSHVIQIYSGFYYDYYHGHFNSNDSDILVAVIMEKYVKNQ